MKALIFAVFAVAAFTSPLSAADEASSFPVMRYRPPRGRDEQQVLKQMWGAWAEAQGAYGRGTDPYDYLRVVIRAFRGGPQDLAKFFRWSYQGTGSAAGGEMNNDLTLSLFYHWGDRHFAEVLSRQSLEVRRGVGSHLWLKPTAISTFAKKFPATAKAALLAVPPA